MDKNKCPHCNGINFEERNNKPYGAIYYCEDCGCAWPKSGILIKQPKKCEEHKKDITFCTISLMSATKVSHCCVCGMLYALEDELNIFAIELPDDAISDEELSLDGEISAHLTTEFLATTNIDKTKELQLMDAIFSIEDKIFPVKLLVHILPTKDIRTGDKTIKGVGVRALAIINSTIIKNDTKAVSLIEDRIKMINTPHNTAVMKSIVEAEIVKQSTDFA